MKRVRPESYVEDILGPGGLFEQEIPGYVSRPVQVDLACRYAAHLVHASLSNSRFLTEAPCGTGKTYAYLVPLIYTVFSGQKHQIALVSTAGISLQEQLMEKDIPLIARILAPHLDRTYESILENVILQKGVSNYVCARKLADSEIQSELLSEDLTLGRWALSNPYSELSQAPKVPSPRTLPLLTSSSDECRGSDCKHSSCGVLGMRNTVARMTQGIVVMNHHVYALSWTGERDNIRKWSHVVFDEAHELPTILLEASSSRFTAKTVQKLIDQTSDPSKYENHLKNIFPSENVEIIPDRVIREFSSLAGQLEFQPPPQDRAEQKALARNVSRLRQFGSANRHCFLLKEQDGSPVAVAVAKKLEMPPQSAFFSATIRYEAQFKAYLNNFELPPHTKPKEAFGVRLVPIRVTTYVTPSPFDWKKQCLVYLPRNAPLPSDPNYHAKLQQIVLDIVGSTDGRALVACSSWNTVKALHSALQRTPYKILVQGSLPKTQLIEAFRSDTHSVMVGTLSLWTGVDVPGEALSALILDKMPFKGSPGLREASFMVQGRPTFREVVLPEVTNLMAQGFGRLIRSVSDRGVCAILDPRMNPYSEHYKSYTRPVWDSVVPQEAGVTMDLDEVRTFFR